MYSVVLRLKYTQSFGKEIEGMVVIEITERITLVLGLFEKDIGENPGSDPIGLVSGCKPSWVIVPTYFKISPCKLITVRESRM